MRVRVLFFGVLKEVAGKSADAIDLQDGSCVRDVLLHYSLQVPKLEGWLPSIALAVNQQYAGPETTLRANDEVALLPPVSGGSADAAGETQPPHTEEHYRYASIVRETINTPVITSRLKHADDGAAVVFEGVVRNQTRGRRTLCLDYSAYEEMAHQQLEKLATEALERFQIRDVAIVHRLGRLEIGDTSVLIAVASAHRGPAFDACRWIIDALKKTVPIWKKEYFEDGAVWADGEPFPAEIPRANS
jgi:molybdopterin synthase catalytic subunit/molybdopterin converting factor small subunit